MNDADLTKVNAALDGLLERHDPTVESYGEFRGHQFDAGLAWVMYPEGHGGLGLDRRLQRVVDARLRKAGAPNMDPSAFFMFLVAPTIATHGSESVRRRFLRPLFTGEEMWCQLFSEPGAGSDFAGLATRATRDGDEWTVNGQKVWNTLAHVADWGMLVTRTDPGVPKHRGMTYFALDMKAPGVEVRPLRQITGEAEFNEVYLTDVRVPDAHRIGPEGEGWRVAITTLMNERNAIGGGGGPKKGEGPIGRLMSLWRDAPEHRRTGADRDDVIRLWIRAETLRLTNTRARQAAKARNPGPEGSVGKAMWATLNQDIYNKAVDLLGMQGQVGLDYTFKRPGEIDLDGIGPGEGRSFLRARANSIEGGTTEVMKNILGEQVLGLPGEPRVDKEIPWVDIPRN